MKDRIKIAHCSIALKISEETVKLKNSAELRKIVMSIPYS